GPDLPPEAVFRPVVARTQQALQGHLPPQRRLPGAVDDAHAAPAQLAEQLELPERAPRRPGRALVRRLLRLRLRGPLFRLLRADLQFQEPGQQCPLFAAQVRLVQRPAARVAEEVGAAPALAGVEE